MSDEPDLHRVAVGLVAAMIRERYPDAAGEAIAAFVERLRPVMHHRRYASGRRTCDLDGQNPAANAPGHEDTHDPTSVDCPLCIADLRARNLLPEAHP